MLTERAKSQSDDWFTSHGMALTQCALTGMGAAAKISSVPAGVQAVSMFGLLGREAWYQGTDTVTEKGIQEIANIAGIVVRLCPHGFHRQDSRALQPDRSPHFP